MPTHETLLKTNQPPHSECEEVSTEVESRLKSGSLAFALGEIVNYRLSYRRLALLGERVKQVGEESSGGQERA